MYLSLNKTGYAISMKSNEQKWELINLVGDLYYLKNYETSKLLEASLDSSLYVMSYSNLTNQIWQLNEKTIRNKANNQVIDSIKSEVFTQFGYGSMSQNWIILFEDTSINISTITTIPSMTPTSALTSNHLT
jgi:hypothetical protein